MEYFDLKCSPEQAASSDYVQRTLEQLLQKNKSEFRWRIEKKSIDARGRSPIMQLRIGILPSGLDFPAPTQRHFELNNPKHSCVIVGSGPAGLFAALRCLELNIKPIILERGKDVRSRRRDLVSITRHGEVNDQSNYCYGEGGAGTYSDGKLYTRSTKKGSVRRILETLVQFGAQENILTESHPHVGTNKLPGIISAMREAILQAGGEVHFETQVSDFVLEGNKIAEVICANGKRYACEFVVLATGHSARDIFELLDRNKIALEPKAFAIGVRIEHQQQFIDKMQYRCESRGEYLPPAAYSIVTQVNDRGVYSFCMCPGGIVAPCATEPTGVVTNGWSPSKRNNEWANSGIVVEASPTDWEALGFKGNLGGMKFQRSIEEKAFQVGGKNQCAPAQRASDFIQNKISKDLPISSYQPGITSSNLRDVFPEFIWKSIQEALIQFEKKMPGYASNNALLIAPETRTSSPVRIPRDSERLHHPEIHNLFPCGEGAGYAGGIASAAIDGERVADAIALLIAQA